MLRKKFEPRRDEVTGEWRRLHNEELYALYSSQNIIRVIKSRRLRWVGHVARMGARRGATGFSWSNLRKGDHLVDTGVDGRIILNSISDKWDRGKDKINLAQDTDRWWAVVNAVMKLQVP